ncbi:hypothetical protein HYQ45_007581 [Verticillium longisporum]|uniref:Nucleoside phosphorylase domain-containing protein n=1 Tax=Verticillium longisporum TaxID=100787 RepID=A0A8I2ZNZ0_VERLO|nr:hypothetical protein HYQ45_007581 [Verticillium longisporum]
MAYLPVTPPSPPVKVIFAQPICTISSIRHQPLDPACISLPIVCFDTESQISSTHCRSPWNMVLSITQMYCIADMARAKLSLEATQPDPNLRFMIGHLNVLEPLMLELSDAEVEHQKYFHRYASGPTKPVEFHNLQLDTVTEELPGEDSGFSRDNLEQQHTISSHRDVFSTILDLGPNVGFRASRLVTDDAGIVPRPQEARTAAKIRASALFKKVSALAVYGRPSAKSDILFPEDYPHNPGRTSCAACDQSKAMHRPERQRSKIHHGLIASGDSVLKSAALRREAMHSLSDVLCFEMEAAGLMGEFPCVVIRGIADYADSHKNDEWHHFTAAAAAACTKELLSYLDPEDIPAACTDSVGAAGTDDGRPPAGHVFNGTGIQHSGAGGFSVGRGLHIG